MNSKQTINKFELTYFIDSKFIVIFSCFFCCFLKEKSENFASDVSFPGIFVIDDTGGSGKDDVSELSGWEQVILPFLHVGDGDVVSWGDNTAFVDSSVQVDDDLGAWSDHDLSVVSLFSVGDAFQAIGEGGHSDHDRRLFLNLLVL